MARAKARARAMAMAMMKMMAMAMARSKMMGEGMAMMVTVLVMATLIAMAMVMAMAMARVTVMVTMTSTAKLVEGNFIHPIYSAESLSDRPPGGWREVAVALEDGSIKGDGSGNKGGGRFVVPLFLSLLTFSLFTFHFPEHLKRGAKKRSLRKNCNLF
jgi:hypothetical protein